MTTEQTEHELIKIRRNAFTYDEYIRHSRVGEKFKMSRADKREVYSTHLEQQHDRDEERRYRLKNRLSDAGNRAYNAITKHRDEVMYEDA